MKGNIKTAFLIVVTFIISGALGGQIEVKNNCGQRIFVKNAGSNQGPFNLEHGQSRNFQLKRDASSRVWAHIGCDTNGNNCDTTEGYVSLAEMKWDDSRGMIGFTWYDISQVDGYNLPITMQPYNPAAGGNCKTVSCNFNINECPAESRVFNKNRLVGCRNKNRDGITEYSRKMKARCPGVYTWSKDDKDGMRACQPGNNGLKVIFC